LLRHNKIQFRGTASTQSPNKGGMLRGVSFKQPGFANSLILRIGLLIVLALAPSALPSIT
jgi:hypothetical protein